MIGLDLGGHAASTRVVIGVGAESGQNLPGRAAVAVAERLGITPVTFPGGQGGFLGGAYGSTGDPDAFAAPCTRSSTADDPASGQVSRPQAGSAGI
jgi:hypothetical protein